MDQSTSRDVRRQKAATVIFDSECPKVVDRFRFRFLSCPGHEEGGSSRKGLGA